MLLSFGLAAAIAGALGVLVAALIGFGHRYNDAGAKFLEKSKGDELNEIRLAIRDEKTIPALEKLWNYLYQTNQVMRKGGHEMEIRALPYDIERRGPLTKLINDLMQSFKTEWRVKQCWDDLMSYYKRVGKALYESAAFLGTGGYTLVILSLTSLLDPLAVETGVSASLVSVGGGILMVRGYATHRKIQANLKVYQNAVQEYLLEVPKVR